MTFAGAAVVFEAKRDAEMTHDDRARIYEIMLREEFGMQAGAEIISSRREIFSAADIVLQVLALNANPVARGEKPGSGFATETRRRAQCRA